MNVWFDRNALTFLKLSLINSLLALYSTLSPIWCSAGQKSLPPQIHIATANPKNKSDKIDPCLLLTKEEIEGVLGVPVISVTSVIEPEPRDCSYITKDPMITLFLITPESKLFGDKSISRLKQVLEGIKETYKAQAVPNLGDDAIWV